MPFASDFVSKSQATTPLLDALRECANKHHAPFYAPGHKRGQGIPQQLADCFGSAVFRADLPELAELDNLFAPQGVIQSAQQLAAAAFGAENTWFLVNGSTCGVEAAILATCATGDKIILPRNVHQSAIAGIILSGAIPVFLNPEYDSVLDIAHSITPAAVAGALEQHPDAKAVMMVYPTYYGVCGDVAALATLAHQYNIPLLGLLKTICAYPESAGLEDHLQIIKSEISEFKPSRIAIDSLSALARGVSDNAFRQFVIGVTGYAKQEEITGSFNNTTEQFMGAHSITYSHISTITDTILMLQYVEIRGEMFPAINVFKMRGSWHDKGIREYTISADEPKITDSFRNYERIISGSPTRVTVDEKAELSRILKGFQDKAPDPQH